MPRLIDLPTRVPTAEEVSDSFWTPQELVSFATHPGTGRVLVIRTGPRALNPFERRLQDTGYRLGRLAITRDPSSLPEAAATFLPHLVYVELGEPHELCLLTLETLAADPRTAEIPLVALMPPEASPQVIDDAYSRSGCDFLRQPCSDVELLARTHLLVRLRNPEMPALGRPETPVANSAPGVRLDLTDPDSGLYTANYLHHRMPSEIARARRYGRPLSVVVLRLREPQTPLTQARLAAILRTSDIAAQLEPDLVVAVLPETDASGAERVQQRCAEAFDDVVASCGAATLDDDVALSFSATGLLKLAMKRAGA